jgi:hypothetical protein
VRRCADLYRLQDWTLTISTTPAPDDAFADIDIPAGQKRAVIRLGPKFWTASADDQRQTIAHELTHCHHALTDAVIAVVRESGKLTTTDSDWLNEQYKLAREYAVDGIADAVAGWLPVLVW